MYGKIFSEIFDSSIVQYGHDTMYVLMCMVILSDPGGYVRFDPLAFAQRITMPGDEVRKAIENLEKPDPNSSNPEYEGRRIIPLKELTGGTECRGWWIVSHERWLRIARQIDKLERTRERVARWKEKKRGNAPVTQGNALVTPGTPLDSYSYSDSDAYSKGLLRKSPADSIAQITSKWNEFAKKHGLPVVTGVSKGTKRLGHLNARLSEKGFDFDKLMTIVEGSPFLLGQVAGKKSEPFFATFDWLICPNNYQKVIEGNYLKRSAKQSDEEWKKFSELINKKKEAQK